jgi:transforming growth factor-beta-induced protein
MSFTTALKGVGIVVAGVVFAACSPADQTANTTAEPTAIVERPMGDSAENMMAEKNIVETAADAGQFNTLLQLATQAGLAETLSTAEVTVFAPTDAAFAKLPAATLQAVQNDPELLANVLKYHVVAGSVPASEVVGMTSANTLLGQPLTVKVEGGSVMINNATVTTADVQASNGIIHIIDTVLVPTM